MPYTLITGASSGIGRQCAIQLSERYNLILCARRSENLEVTKSLCKNPQNHLVLTCDLSDIENIEKNLIDFMNSNNITISNFLHCAGQIGLKPLKLVDIKFIQYCVNVNMISAELIIKTLVNKKINSNELRSVVFISSNISNRGAKAFSVYSASKSGLDGMMRSLAIELAPKVRLNSVLPGTILTDMTKFIEHNKELLDRMEKNYPMGIGKPQYIADAVDFLFSDRSTWITGQQLVVDGGRNINISE